MIRISQLEKNPVTTSDRMFADRTMWPRSKLPTQSQWFMGSVCPLFLVPRSICGSMSLPATTRGKVGLAVIRQGSPDSCAWLAYLAAALQNGEECRFGVPDPNTTYTTRGVRRRPAFLRRQRLSGSCVYIDKDFPPKKLR